MTDDTTPTQPASEAPAADAAPAAAPTADAAPAAAPITQQTAVKPRKAGFWILASAAGATLLIVGLLGGILIGQHTRGAGIGDRAGFSTSTDQGTQTPGTDSLQEQMPDRQGGGNSQEQTGPNQGQNRPSAPAPGTDSDTDGDSGTAG